VRFRFALPFYPLPRRPLRLFPSLVGVVAAVLLQNCGGDDLSCGGPFCVTPPERQEATRLRAASGDGQVGAPGRELPQPLEVVVTDDENRPIPDVEVSFTVVGQGGGTLSKPAIRSDHHGRVQVRWTLGVQPGVQTVQAMAANSSGSALNGAPLTLSAEAVRPRAARILFLQAPPVVVQSGLLFAQQPVVRILDPDNQPVAEVDVTVSIASGAGTLNGTTTVSTDTEGRATYGDLMIRGPIGLRTLRFSLSDPVLEVVSGSVQVEAGTGILVVGNEPLAYQGTVNSPVSPAPSVLVRDADGNPVPGVAISFEAGGDGSVSPLTVMTDEAGVAQVTSWTLGRSAAVEYSLVARAQSAGNPVVFSATAQAGAAGKLEINVQPSASAQSGAPFSRQPVLQVADELGNPAARAGLAITATLLSGPTGALQHASATTNSSGLATFTGLSLTGLVGDYRLTFSAPTLTGVASDPISVAAGPPARLAMTGLPSAGARSRVPFGTQPSIQLQDASGNPVAHAGVEVSASIASGGGTLGGQASVLTNGEGRADYTDLAIIGSPGTRTLLFASTTPASEVVSPTITLPSVAAISLLTPPPGPVVVGTRVAAPISWTLIDAANQPVADAPVVLSVSAGGSVEPVAASDPDGIVRLSAWTVSQIAGTQYVDLSVPGAEVSRVTVEAVPDAAFRLQKTTGDGQSAPINDDLPQPLVVRVTDQYGNGVGGVTVEWRTCDGIGDYNTPTDIEGYASAFQSTGPTPGEFCAMASSLGLVDSPAQFSYSVTSGTEPVSPSTTSQLRAGPLAPAPERATMHHSSR
jgi:adhesin/invasin